MSPGQFAEGAIVGAGSQLPNPLPLVSLSLSVSGPSVYLVLGKLLPGFPGRLDRVPPGLEGPPFTLQSTYVAWCACRFLVT